MTMWAAFVIGACAAPVYVLIHFLMIRFKGNVQNPSNGIPLQRPKSSSQKLSSFKISSIRK